MENRGIRAARGIRKSLSINYMQASRPELAVTPSFPQADRNEAPSGPSRMNRGRFAVPSPQCAKARAPAVGSLSFALKLFFNKGDDTFHGSQIVRRHFFIVD
jgi:hypothetical protein